MNFFTQQGRTLLLAAILAVGSVWLAGCGGGDKPSELVGHWEHYEGAKRGVPEDIELFKDGTGVLDKDVSSTWKVENKRLVFLSASKALSCNYEVSGYELILTYDDEKSTTFVKKGKREEYKKKKENEDEEWMKKEKERVKKEGKRMKKETERVRKNAEQGFEKISSYFTDLRDGQKYRTVSIGGKIWMAQNLNYQTGKSWCYEGDNSNCEIYGRLYDWNTAKSVCPREWRLPSRKEWNDLEAAVGGKVAGLKSTYGWIDSGNGTDNYGFSALPGGSNDPADGFIGLGAMGIWWVDDAYSRATLYNMDDMIKHEDFSDSVNTDSNEGLSIRCVKDDVR